MTKVPSYNDKIDPAGYNKPSKTKGSVDKSVMTPNSPALGKDFSKKGEPTAKVPSYKDVSVEGKECAKKAY